MHELELGLLGQLLAGRLAAKPGLEPGLRARQLHAPLVDVRRDADRRGLVRDRPLAGLADPPGGVGRELEPLAPVELLDGTVQSDHALLDEIQQRQVLPLVALGDRDHQAQVRVDHALLGLGVAPLDTLGERDLLRRGQQRVAAGALHEERERVGRRGRVRVRRGGRNVRRRLDDLDLPGLELGAQLDEILLVEVVLERERLQGGLVDRLVLLGLFEERGDSKFKRGGAQFCSHPSLRGCRANVRAFATNTYNGLRGRRIPCWTKKIRRAGFAFVHLARLTFRFRVLPSGEASSYSRSVLGARGNLARRTGPYKALKKFMCALCEVFSQAPHSRSSCGSTGSRSSRRPRASSSSSEKRPPMYSRISATCDRDASRSFACPSSVSSA